MAFKLAGITELFGRKAISAIDATVMEAASANAPDPGTQQTASRLPLIGRLTTAKQFQILIVAFVILLVTIGAITIRANRVATQSAAFVSGTGQMRMLSERLGKSSQLALQGNVAAFKELRESRDTFSALLDSLQRGGEIDGIAVPPSPTSVQADLQALAAEWDKSNRNATLLLEQEKNLVLLGKAVGEINARNPQLLELTEQIAALKLQGGAPPREVAAATQLTMLTQRMAKNANSLMVANAVDPEIAFLLGKDTNTFRDLVQALAKGSEVLRVAPPTSPELRDKLAELEIAFNQHRESISGILSNLQRLVQAKQAGARVFSDTAALFAATDNVAAGYAGLLGGQGWLNALITLLALLAISTLVLILKLYNDETRRQTASVEQQRQVVEQEKNMQQQAILRLMNEMGDLADGDLTVRATVTEDVTGAIADSVNYTIEELSVLVKRINEAATRVTSATESARQTSTSLLAANERQAREIQDAGSAALAMAQQMNQVSRSAVESAQVARASLAAAQKGAVAVENSIRGMNEIREQIQDTSKRIKRLGESSQEIGEIVELISDITEQTNVLALNAAIQAASAGEAGRGFTVVAEEVQRLAERSAEATKQIAAIVKAIQTDTQDAVSAMERSTRNVVEGAKLSDAAGQALSEISKVSTGLTRLIEQISTQTEKQATQATQVAETMKSILRVTQQTTAGTKETAVSIGQLAELAVELKGSVSGFKV